MPTDYSSHQTSAAKRETPSQVMRWRNFLLGERSGERSTPCAEDCDAFVEVLVKIESGFVDIMGHGEMRKVYNSQLLILGLWDSAISWRSFEVGSSRLS